MNRHNFRGGSIETWNPEALKHEKRLVISRELVDLMTPLLAARILSKKAESKEFSGHCR